MRQLYNGDAIITTYGGTSCGKFIRKGRKGIIVKREYNQVYVVKFEDDSTHFYHSDNFLLLDEYCQQDFQDKIKDRMK